MEIAFLAENASFDQHIIRGMFWFEMPDGCRGFGSFETLSSNLSRLMKIWKKKDDFKLVRNNSSHDHDFFSDMISGDWIHPKKGLPYIALFPATEPSFGGVNWRRRTLWPHDSLIKVKSTNYTTWIKFNSKMKLDVEGLCGALVFLWINRRRESFW